MNTNKLTQKTMEALSSAQNTAVEYGNMQIEPEHILLALLTQDGGLIPSLLEKSGADCRALENGARTAVEALPKVSGPGREDGKIYVSSDTDRILTFAEKTAERMKDEYVSVEHIFFRFLKTLKRRCKNSSGTAA